MRLISVWAALDGSWHRGTHQGSRGAAFLPIACTAKADDLNNTISPPAAWLWQPWQAMLAWTRAFADHRDPLVQASNWVALLIGTHLPFWPLYVWWSAGAQALPSAFWTLALTPAFLAIPLISRRSGLLGRVATVLLGVVNTAFTVWVLGENSGTALFLAPCTALATISFRRAERGLMVLLAALPLVVYFVLRHHAPLGLHHYDVKASESLFALNVISISVLAAAFGWLQADIYRRMESAPSCGE